MSHVVLLGDSIFDNALYVPDRPPVIEQVRRGLPTGWKATLLAVDGHTVEHISTQLPRIPTDATHLVLSIGGNNALMAGEFLRELTKTVWDAQTLLAGVFLTVFEPNTNRCFQRYVRLVCLSVFAQSMMPYRPFNRPNVQL
jgi:hypothetical protein